MVEEKQSLTAPDFTTTDSEGKILHLSDYKGNKNIVLVFNRGFF
jgi:peroxiredoxin